MWTNESARAILKTMTNVSKERQFDQFYTQDTVADECLSILWNYLSEVYSTNEIGSLTFLEPSAGDGAFIRALEAKGSHKFYAYDIDPHSGKIKKHDFLKDDLEAGLKSQNVIVIGNPPFGKRAKQAIEFVNRAADYAEVVAFILPLQFQKYSAQNQLRPDLRLVVNQKLRPESFVFNGKPYAVRCCFQIWTTKTIGKDLRLRQPPVTKHCDFDMWQYNNTREAEKYFDKKTFQWDFAVPRQGYKDYTIRATDPDDMDHRTQWIFFRAHNETVLKRLYELDFTTLSQKNTSTPGFGKADVIGEYERLFGAQSMIDAYIEKKTPQTLFNLARFEQSY